MDLERLLKGYSAEHGKSEEDDIASALGNSAGIVRKMAEDDSIMLLDPEEITTAIRDSRIRRAAMRTLRSADESLRDTLSHYADWSYGKPWSERAAYIGGTAAGAGLYGAAAIGSTAGSIGSALLPFSAAASLAAFPVTALAAASFACLTLTAVTHRYAKTYQESRDRETWRIKGRNLEGYEAFVQSTIARIEEDAKERRFREKSGTIKSSYTSPDPSWLMEKKNKAEERKQDAERDVLRAYELDRNTAEKRTEILDEIASVTDEMKNSYGEPLGEKLSIARKPYGNFGKDEGQRIIDDRKPRDLLTVPFSVKDGIERGIVIDSMGNTDAYASAVKGAYGSDDEALKAAEKALSEAFTDMRDKMNAAVESAKIKRSGFIDYLNSPASKKGKARKAYEAIVSKGMEIPKNDDDGILVDSIAGDSEGHQLLFRYAKSIAARADGPEKRTDGCTAVITDTGFNLPPFTIGSVCSLRTFAENLRSAGEKRERPAKADFTISAMKDDSTPLVYSGTALLKHGMPEGGILSIEKEKLRESLERVETQKADEPEDKPVPSHLREESNTATGNKTDNASDENNVITQEDIDRYIADHPDLNEKMSPDGRFMYYSDDPSFIPEPPLSQAEIRTEDERKRTGVLGNNDPKTLRNSLATVRDRETRQIRYTAYRFIAHDRGLEHPSMSPRAVYDKETEIDIEAEIRKSREGTSSEERMESDAVLNEEPAPEKMEEAERRIAEHSSGAKAPEKESEGAWYSEDNDKGNVNADGLPIGNDSDTDEKRQEEEAIPGESLSPEAALIADSEENREIIDSYIEENTAEVPEHEDTEDIIKDSDIEEASPDTVVTDERTPESTIDSNESTEDADVRPDEEDEKIHENDEFSAFSPSDDTFPPEYPDAEPRETEKRTYLSGDGKEMLCLVPEFHDGLPTGGLYARLYEADGEGNPGSFIGSVRFREFSRGIPDRFIISGKDAKEHEIDLASGWFRTMDDRLYKKMLENPDGRISPDGSTLISFRNSNDGSWEATVYKKTEGRHYAPGEILTGNGSYDNTISALIPDYESFKEAEPEDVKQALSDGHSLEENELSRYLLIQDAEKRKPYPGYSIDAENNAIILTGVVTRDKVEDAINAAARDGKDIDTIILDKTRLITVDAFASADEIAKTHGMSITGFSDLNKDVYALKGTEIAWFSPFAALRNARNVHFENRIPDFGFGDRKMAAPPLFKGRTGLVLTTGEGVSTIPDGAFSECTIKAYIDASTSEDHVIEFRKESFAFDDPDAMQRLNEKKKQYGKNAFVSWYDYQSQNVEKALASPVNSEDIERQKKLYHASLSATLSDDRKIINESGKLKERFRRNAMAVLLREYRETDEFVKSAFDKIPGFAEIQKELEKAVAEGRNDEEIRSLKGRRDSIAAASPATEKILAEYLSRPVTDASVDALLRKMQNYARLIRDEDDAKRRIDEMGMKESLLRASLRKNAVTEAGNEHRTYLSIRNLSSSSIGEGAFRGRQLYIDNGKEGDEILSQKKEEAEKLRTYCESNLPPYLQTALLRPGITEGTARIAMRSFRSDEKESILKAVLSYSATISLIERMENGEVLLRAKGSRTQRMGMQNTGISAVLETDRTKDATKEIARCRKRISELTADEETAKAEGNEEKQKRIREKIQYFSKRIRNLETPKEHAITEDSAYAGNKGLSITNIADASGKIFAGCAPRLRVIAPDGTVRTSDNRRRKRFSADEALSVASTTIKGISASTKKYSVTGSLLYLAGTAAIAPLFAFLSVLSLFMKKAVPPDQELRLRAKADAIIEMGYGIKVTAGHDGLDIVPDTLLTRSERSEVEALMAGYRSLYSDDKELSNAILMQDLRAENMLMEALDKEDLNLSREDVEEMRKAADEADRIRDARLRKNGIDGDTGKTRIYGGRTSDERPNKMTGGRNDR